jgi:tRNA(fMet)-specific endonuclease VapC
MVQKVILDSNIIIDIYNGHNDTRTEIQKIGTSNLCISVITYGEAIYGAVNKADRAKWKKHLDKYSILQINDHIGSLFMGLMDKFSLSHNLMIPDAFIAATSIYYKLPLFSNNKKDFEFIPNLLLYKSILDV